MLALSAHPKMISRADGDYAQCAANSSEDCYEPSLTRVLGLALRMVPAPLGYIALTDGTWALISPARALNGHDQSLLREQLDAFCVLIARHEEPLAVPNLLPSPAVLVNEHPLRAYVGASIVLDKQIVGVFCLADHALHAWRDEETRLIAELATMVALDLRLRDELHLFQRVERELQAVRRLQRLSEHTRCLAHDVANLLAAVAGNAELALLDLPSDSPVCDALQTIGSAAARAVALNRQMLRHAHGDEPNSERDIADLNAIVRETVATCRPVIPAAVALVTDLASDLPPIHMSSSQLNRVVLNLLVNGADAIGNKTGTIALHTAVDGQGWVTLDVMDSGCGMDAETLAHIFEPHYTTKPQGHGLGLVAVKAIVEEHGGAIAVMSAVRSGTTMTINLPCVAGLLEEVEAVQPLLAQACGDSSGT